MNKRKESWHPTAKQKSMAEKYIWPMIRLTHIFTSWYMVMIWAFLFPYFLGQSFLFSVFLSAVATTMSLYLWREPLEDYDDE
jgi:hypothetical protein